MTPDAVPDDLTGEGASPKTFWRRSVPSPESPGNWDGIHQPADKPAAETPIEMHAPRNGTRKVSLQV